MTVVIGKGGAVKSTPKADKPTKKGGKKEK